MALLKSVSSFISAQPTEDEDEEDEDEDEDAAHPFDDNCGFEVTRRVFKA